MTGAQWREIAVGFVVVAFVLMMFILRGGGSYSVAQDFELTLVRQSSAAGNVRVQMWLGKEPPSCTEEQRGNYLQFEGTTDRNGHINRRQEVSWGSFGARRAAGRMGRQVFQLCAWDAGVAAWRPLWSAKATDVARRELKIVCELNVPEGSGCRHVVSSDPDRDWRDYWVPLLLAVLFIRLLMFGLKIGAGRVWTCLAISTILLFASRGAAQANLVEKSVFLLVAAAGCAVAAHILLWRVPGGAGLIRGRTIRFARKLRNPFDS